MVTALKKGEKWVMIVTDRGFFKDHYSGVVANYVCDMTFCEKCHKRFACWTTKILEIRYTEISLNNSELMDPKFIKKWLKSNKLSPCLHDDIGGKSWET